MTRTGCFDTNPGYKVVSIRTQAVKLHKNFVHFKYHLRVNKDDRRVIEYNNNNNNKLYLHDHNKVLQYCKSYLKLTIDSL